METVAEPGDGCGHPDEQVERRSPIPACMRISLPGYLRLKKLAEGLCPCRYCGPAA